MTLYIAHPATGTYLDLSECIVTRRAPLTISAAEEPKPVAGPSDIPKAYGLRRTYLMAVAEGGGEGREAVVLSTLGGDSQVYNVEGDLEYDDIHDLFVDIF